MPRLMILPIRSLTLFLAVPSVAAGAVFELFLRGEIAARTAGVVGSGRVRVRPPIYPSDFLQLLLSQTLTHLLRKLATSLQAIACLRPRLHGKSPKTAPDTHPTPSAMPNTYIFVASA